MFICRSEYLPSALYETASQWRVGQTGTCIWCSLEADVQPMPGGGDQSLECAECRLSTSGLVRTDDALGNMCSASDIGLRVGAGTRLTEQ